MTVTKGIVPRASVGGRRVRALLMAAAVLVAPCGAATPARGQAPPPAIESSVGTDEWIRADASFSLQVNGGPVSGRLAVLIGDTDWTGLFEAAGDRLVLRPGPVRLPSGVRDLVVYGVEAAGAWHEVGRVALRVLTPAGFEQAEARPALQVGLSGLVAEGQTPPAETRGAYQDLTVTLGTQTTLLRSGWTTRGQTNFVGVSNQREALRAGLEGENAPRFDLADYLVKVENGSVEVSAGHVSVGASRYLVNGFSSRGTAASVRLAPALDASFGLTNGTAIVGFPNLLGLATPEHRIATGAVGVEFVPGRRGALRGSATWMSGSVLPIANFNQGALTDAERSLGLGIDVASSGARHNVTASLARSRFENPDDPLLSQGLDVVPVRETTRGAQFVDATVTVVPGVPIGATHAMTVAAGFTHERVEPLYRSVAAPVQADLLRSAASATAAVGPVGAQVSFMDARDNLARLASVLTTRTRQLQWTTTVPLAALAGGSAAWPEMSYTLSRTHQFGERLPIDGDFDDPSQVPDQVSLNQGVGVAWQGPAWRAGYQFSRSFQDNRQVGRQLADFLNMAHTVSLGVSPVPGGDLNLDIGWDGARNFELAERDVTRRVGVSGSWRPGRGAALSGGGSVTFFRNTPDTRQQRTTDLNAQFAQTIPFGRGRQAPGAQLFVRATRQSLYALERLFGGETDQNSWAVTTGITLQVF